MSLDTIIVDDQDAKISYTGQWSLAGEDMDYRHSRFSSQNPGASAKFTFTGTSMILMGSVDPGVACNATISLDGQNFQFPSPNVNTNVHQTALWSSQNLSDGSHTFVYTVESCANSTGNLWLDYILYNSSSTASDGSTLFIDDRNPKLQYSGNWEQAGEDGDFMHTRQGGKTGSSVQLAFQGSSISVFGRVDNQTSNGIVSASFSIDGSTPVSFATSAQSFISYNKQLFQSRVLDTNTTHNLLITSNSDNPIWIDYLLIQNGSSTPITTTNTSPEVTPSSGSHPSTAAIAGGAAGGFGFLVLAIIVARILRNYNRSQPNRPRPSSPSRHSKMPSISTSVAHRPIDLQTMSSRQRNPYNDSINHSRADLTTIPDFVSEDPFASPAYSLRGPESIHSRRMSENSINSRSIRRGTITTADHSYYSLGLDDQQSAYHFSRHGHEDQLSPLRHGHESQLLTYSPSRRGHEDPMSPYTPYSPSRHGDDDQPVYSLHGHSDVDQQSTYSRRRNEDYFRHEDELTVSRHDSLAPSSSYAASSSTQSRIIVNQTDENPYPRDVKKGDNLLVLTQSGMYSTAAPVIHSDSGVRLNMEDLVHRVPEELPPMYTRD